MIASPNTLNVLGTRIGVVNMTTTLAQLDAWIQEPPAGRYVCVTGVHGVMESLRDPAIRTAHQDAALCVPDGMPMSWLGWLKGHSAMNRVYGPDLMEQTLAYGVPRAWSHFFYGGKPGIAEELSRQMQTRFHGLRVAGTHCPPFRPLTEQEETDTITTLNQDPPDIVWIGLSTPKQELLMRRLRGRVQAKILIGVGAAFDYLTGHLHRPPAWIQRAGLEWFYRTCMEPRRLAPRYFRNNPLFVWHILLQLTGLRRYPDDTR